MLIRKLELVLENCEVVTIDGKYIGDFHIGDIRKELSRMACNHIDLMEVCHDFCLEIHKDANKRYAPFGDEKSSTLTFDRLMQYNDITSIIVHLYDQYNEETKNDESKDQVEHYYVQWEGESDYENDVQHSKVAKTGWFYMTIGKDVNLEDMFQADEVDDAEYADFHASMMDIGDKYWTEHEEMLKHQTSTTNEDENN